MKQDQAEGVTGDNVKQTIPLPKINDVKRNEGVEGD